jgi:hypothetical protein
MNVRQVLRDDPYGVDYAGDVAEDRQDDDTSVLLTTGASGNGPQISIPPPGFITTLSLSAL